jgi:ribokinase
MSLKKIVVIGSINTDMVVKTLKLPVPGETILGGKFLMTPGGKGANQAVAAARLGGNVSFIGKIGSDIFGKESKTILKSENINTSYLFIDKINPSGVALITVDKNGENCIVVASGSNACLSVSDIETAKDLILSSDIIVVQLEIPIETVEYIVDLCNNNDKTVILNPAPATKLSDKLLSKVSVIIPNETEAELLTGVKVSDLASAEQAARYLSDKGIPVVVVTLGSKGALLCTSNETQYIPAPLVESVDTTGAGDVFCGALALSLSKGIELAASVGFANKAASISVTRMGAQASAPYINEIEKGYLILKNVL